MREVDITEECLEFIDKQGKRTADKFFQLIEVISEVKTVHAGFIKKLQSSSFYELRIKAGNEYRVILFSVDHINFSECTKAVCLFGFVKKSTKDYKKAIRRAEKLLSEYLEKL